MKLELFISMRYLRSNRGKGFVSFLAGVSTIGLILAVTALITVLSVMNGFQQEIRERILNAISHAQVSAYDGTMNHWDTVKATIDAHPEVLESAPFIEKYALISTGEKAQGSVVRGVDPLLEISVSSLLEQLVVGTGSLERGEIVLGKGLASELGVGVGHKVVLLTPDIGASIVGVKTRFKRFVVSGIFESGTGEYDNALALINIEVAQTLYAIDGVSGVRLAVEDLFESRRILGEVMATLNVDRYYGVDWSEQKSNLLRALNLEKQMIAVIVSLIIAVEAFNVVSMMVMVITDKTREIAILRTMGMTPGGIVKIFFLQGIGIGFIGVGVGVVFGVLLASNIEMVMAGIERIFDFQFFPKDLFYISSFPSELRFYDIWRVVVGSLGLVLCAAIYPAWRSGRVNIVEVLSHE